MLTRKGLRGFQFEASPNTAAVTLIIPEQDDAVVDDILSMRKNMGLGVNREDINELVQGHSTELTTEEFLHLQQQQQ